MSVICFTTSKPSTLAVPSSANSSVQRMRNIDVLPAPSGPMSPKTSPFSTANDTSSNAFTRPYDFDMLFTSIAFIIMHYALLIMH